MIITLDIETLPTNDEKIAARIASKIKHPGNIKKAESIAKWEAEERPEAIRDAISKTGLNGAYGSVVCIGYKINDEPAECIHESSENETLLHFGDCLRSIEAHNVHPLTVVGHNHVNFDLRFLFQRYCVNDIEKPPHMPFHAKQWDDRVFDTMAMWAGPGNFVSLDDVCFALNIPGKSDMDGSMVAEYHAQGRTAEIIQYCKNDVEKTYAVYQRLK